MWLTVGGAEVLENSFGQDSSSLNWQHKIVLDPQRFPIKPKLLKQTDSTWVFEILVAVGIEVEGEKSVNESEVKTAIGKALTAELVVSKLMPRLVSHKIFAPKLFSPESMVNVSTFNIQIDYQEARSNGPWVTHSISRKVEDRYALFWAVNEFSNINYTDFELLE